MSRVAKIAVTLAILGGAVSGVSACGYSNSHEETCTVTGKDRTTNSDGASQSRVYTKECGTLQVGDLFFAGEFNSADLYGKLTEGKKYKMQISGVRVGFLSEFPYIRSAEEVS